MSKIEGFIFFWEEPENGGSDSFLGTFFAAILLPALIAAIFFSAFGSRLEIFLTENPNLALRISTLIIPAVLAVICFAMGLKFRKGELGYLVASALIGGVCFLQASVFIAGTGLYTVVGKTPSGLLAMAQDAGEKGNLVNFICILAVPFAIGCAVDILTHFQRGVFAPLLLVLGIEYYFYAIFVLFVVLQISTGDAFTKGGSLVLGTVFFSIPFALILGIRSLLLKCVSLLTKKNERTALKRDSRYSKEKTSYRGKYTKE